MSYLEGKPCRDEAVPPSSILSHLPVRVVGWLAGRSTTRASWDKNGQTDMERKEDEDDEDGSVDGKGWMEEGWTDG